jgi:hypothetical protein
MHCVSCIVWHGMFSTLLRMTRGRAVPVAHFVRRGRRPRVASGRMRRSIRLHNSTCLGGRCLAEAAPPAHSLAGTWRVRPRSPALQGLLVWSRRGLLVARGRAVVVARVAHHAYVVPATVAAVGSPAAEVAATAMGVRGQLMAVGSQVVLMATDRTGPRHAQCDATGAQTMAPGMQTLGWGCHCRQRDSPRARRTRHPCRAACTHTRRGSSTRPYHCTAVGTSECHNRLR